MAEGTASTGTPSASGEWTEAIREIGQALLETSSFSLAVAVGEGHRTRGALRAALAARTPAGTVYREFRVQSNALNPFADYRDSYRWREQVVLFAYGWEDLDEEQRVESFRLMNQSRELLKRGGLKVCILVAPSLIPELRRHAGDLFDWWSAFCRLPVPPTLTRLDTDEEPSLSTGAEPVGTASPWTWLSPWVLASVSGLVLGLLLAFAFVAGILIASG